MRSALLCIAALIVLATGCAESDETYALIRVENATPAVGPIDHVELQVSAGGRMATHQLMPATGALALPTSISLHADSAGPLDIVAIAHGGSAVLARGSVHATLVDGEVNRITVTLGRDSVEGDGGLDATLTASVAELQFGRVAVGQTSPVLSVEISNTGGQPSAALSVDLSTSLFTLASDGCKGSALASGEHCSIGVTMTPVSAEPIMGTLTVGGAVVVDLRGTGVDPGALTITPPSTIFPDTATGQITPPTIFTVKNAGALPLGNLDVKLTGPGSDQFSTGDNTCQNQGLAAQATCTVEVRFQPDAVGSAGASLEVSERGGVSNTATLMGRGVAPSTLSLAGSGALGAVEVGSASASPAVFTITNAGGAATGALTTALTGTHLADFTAVDGCGGSPLPSGMSCTVRITFNPRGRGDRTARLTVEGMPGGSVGADLTGRGLAPANLVLTPLSYDFGAITIGQPARQTFTLENQGDVAAPFTAPTVGAPYTLGTSATPCMSPLSGGASCSLEVVFTPTGTNVATGTLIIGGTALRATLSGRGVVAGQLVAGPTVGLDFPDTLLSVTSSSQRITVTNTGGSPTGSLSPAAIEGTGAAQFEVASDDCTGRSLAALASCDIMVRFHPTVRGNHGATLNVNASPGGQAIATLRGRGLAPGALALTPVTGFGAVAVGTTSPTRAVTVTNTGDVALTAPVALSRAGSHPGDFALSNTSACAVALAAGASCTANVVFTPTVTGTRSAEVAASAGAALAMTGVTGDGITQAALEVAPTAQSFGSIPRSTTGSEIVFTVTNRGQNTSGVPTVSLPGSDFRVTTSTCTTARAQNQTCEVRVVFQPQSTGPKTATLSISATPGGTAQATLTGTGQQPAQLSVQAPGPSHDFGQLETGNTGTRTFTISNSGEASTGMPSVASIGAPFARSTTCTTTLAPGGTCTVVVTFTPGSAGVTTGNIQITASPGGIASLSVTGTGVACLSNARCGGGTPFCDASSHSCRGCAGDAECSGLYGSSAPACSPAGTCVRCLTASHCGGGLQCDAGTYRCVECLSNDHCGGATPICNFGQTCQPCSDNSQCALKNPGTPYCVSGACKQCTSSTQCGSGEVCFSGFCQCSNPCTAGRCGLWTDCHGESVDCGDPCTGSLTCCPDSGRCTLPSSC